MDFCYCFVFPFCFHHLHRWESVSAGLATSNISKFVSMFFSFKYLFYTAVLSIKTAFNLVRIHVLFGIVLLIQWSINNSIFVGHVVIYFFSRVQLGRLKTYIHTSSVIRIYAGIHGWRTNENLCNILNPLYNVMIRFPNMKRCLRGGPRSSCYLKGLGLWCLTPLSILFQLYRRIQFLSGANRKPQRKLPTCRKSLTNFITSCCFEYTSPERDSNSQR
jgi:hypothetical protein